MKILYDYQILRLQRYGGISRYFYELINRLSLLDQCKVEINCIASKNFYFEKYFGRHSGEYSENKVTRKMLNYLNRLVMFFKFMGKYDIFHPTYYCPYMIGKYKGKMIITVHDMIQEIYPEQFYESIREDKKEMILAAHHIIAVSESTKKDLLKFYPEIKSESITVIYHGSNMKKFQGKKENFTFPNKYILFVGGRRGYKNFDNFVDAVIPMLKSDPLLYIVCFGGGKFTYDDTRLMGSLLNRFYQIDSDDDMLSAAYTYAECFVYPSKYEGFGIPVLEAFACDCPVVLSNASSLPEVGGDAAIYCNPNDPISIRKAISKIILSEDCRKALIEKGRKQREKFSWDMTASQTLECYKKVVKNGYKK